MLKKEMRCYAAGRADEAIRQFEEVVKRVPGDGRACFNLAVLLAGADPPRREEAVAHYEKALSLGEQRDEALESRLYP